MASAIGCDLCEQEPAVMMQSNLTNGQTVSVGNACMVTFFAGALAGMVGQLDTAGRTANELSLAMVTDAIGHLPADEVPPAPPSDEDDGISGNQSAGALTQADIDQLNTSET